MTLTFNHSVPEEVLLTLLAPMPDSNQFADVVDVVTFSNPATTINWQLSAPPGQYVVEFFGAWSDGRMAYVWFPVEVHTNMPLVHYLPHNVYRRIFRMLGFKFYAEEENLNLLGARDLKSLFPQGTPLTITGYRLLGMVSNIIAYGTSVYG